MFLQNVNSIGGGNLILKLYKIISLSSFHLTAAANKPLYLLQLNKMRLKFCTMSKQSSSKLV